MGGCAPLGRGIWVPIYHNVVRAETYLHAKFRLDLSNCLATVHERHRQDNKQDRQRTDSIGRTVLQTVAQKRFALCYRTVVLSVLALVYCGQTVQWIKIKLGAR